MPGSMLSKAPPDAAELRAELERAREQIRSSAVTLRQEVARVTDWREWVRRRPALCLGAACALGFYLGYRRRQVAATSSPRRG